MTYSNFKIDSRKDGLIAVGLNSVSSNYGAHDVEV